MRLFLAPIFFLICLSFSTVQAGNDLMLDVKISDSFSNLDLVNAEVEVWKDNVVFKTVRTNKYGKAGFNLPLDNEYYIYFKNKGYHTKFLRINTKNIPEEYKEGGFKSELDVSLFHIRKGFDKTVMKDPIGIAKYNTEKDRIEFDFGYTKSQLKLIRTEQDRIDSLNQKQFGKLFLKAKKLEQDGKITKAEKWYLRAYKLIPSDERVLKKLNFISDELSKPSD